MKRILSLLLCVVLSLQMFSQRKQISEFINLVSSNGLYVPADITYEYLIGEEGETIKDGSYTITGRNDKTTLESYPRTMTHTSSYQLNTTFSKGRLNGPISSKLAMTLTEVNVLTGTTTEKYNTTFTGNFLNGIPNGAFYVNNTVGTKTILKATYKNGKLVGAYNCELITEDNALVKISGTLTQDSKLHGKWVSEYDLGKSNMEFSNGVLISETTSSQHLGEVTTLSTKPSLSELSQKYAQKLITAEELKKQNIFVRKGSFKLGDYARIAIRRDANVDFDRMGGWDLRESNNVSYEYLYEGSVFTDKGLDRLATVCAAIELKREGEYPYNNLVLGFDRSYQDTTYLYTTIARAEDGQRYVQVNTNFVSKEHYTKGSGDLFLEVYLTDDQFNNLLKEIPIRKDQILIQNALNLISIIKYKNSLDDTNIYLLENPQEQTRYRNVSDMIDRIEYVVNNYKTKMKDHPTNNSYLIFRDDRSEKLYYIYKESVLALEKIIEEMKQKEAERIAKEEADRLAREAEAAAKEAERIAKEEADRLAREAEAAAKEAERIAKELEISRSIWGPAFDWMIEQKSPLNICLNLNSEYFYNDSPNSDTWRIEVMAQLKNFCPISGYEILAVSRDEITFKLTKTTKKASTTYLLKIPLYRGKMCIQSFNLKNATIVE